MAEGLDDLSDLRNYILENVQVSATDFMTLMDLCFRYCSSRQEDVLYRVVAESFLELCDRKKAKLAQLQAVRDFCLANPVYPAEKNINRKIVDYAFPIETLTCDEMEHFMQVSDRARRVCSHLHRFWIDAQVGDDGQCEFIVTSNGTQLPITSFDKLCLAIWPEIWPEITRLLSLSHK